MTNTPRLAKTVGNKPIKRTSKQSAKKAESYLGVKTAILMLSIIGTMGGWLMLLNQEASSAQATDQSTLSFEQVVTDNNQWDQFLSPYKQAVDELKIKLKGLRKQYEVEDNASAFGRD